ncbi:MAG: HAD family hydrolase [Pseudonocardiaceae bacterium]
MNGDLVAGPLQDWVISVDLWGTLLTYGDREAESEWRLREFATVLRHFDHPVPAPTVREAVLSVRQETLHRQRTSGEQPPVRDQVSAMVTAMGITDDRLIDVLLIPHTHAVLRACPQVIPGAHTALWATKTAGARLVLTSNTLATPMSVSRLILDEHGFSGIFDDTVFSSDVGLAKPRPEIFHTVASRSATTPARVVHVGNDWRTDVLGALGAGCRALFFNPREKPSRPSALDITHLDQMLEALLRICTNPPTRSAEPSRTTT